MADRVFIRGLRVPTVIGVYAWEREVRQELVLDFEMAWPMEAAAASDDVADALNYAAVSERVLAFAADASFQLIEAFADAIANLVIEEFAVPWLQLRVAKPGAVRAADDVGVLIERGQLPS